MVLGEWMTTTFNPAPAPDFVMRWPWQAVSLSQYGDASFFGRAMTDPSYPLSGFDFGGAGTIDLRLSSGVPMMGTDSGGSCYLLPWGPTPATEAFFTVREWFDQLPYLTVIRCFLNMAATASTSNGFGFAISDGTGTATTIRPNAGGARGGAWVRWDLTTGFVVLECYHAGGVLTQQFVTPIDQGAVDITFRIWRARPQGPQALPSCDVVLRGAQGGSSPATFERAGLLFGSAFELPPLGVGVDANSAQFTAIIMNSAGGAVATRGAAAAYFPRIM